MQISGAIGETVRGETEVSFANYFITRDRLDIIDMTRPHKIDYTCFVTPKPKPLPQYFVIIWPFQVKLTQYLFQDQWFNRLKQ